MTTATTKPRLPRKTPVATAQGGADHRLPPGVIPFTETVDGAAMRAYWSLAHPNKGSCAFCQVGQCIQKVLWDRRVASSYVVIHCDLRRLPAEA